METAITTSPEPFTDARRYSLPDSHLSLLSNQHITSEQQSLSLLSALGISDGMSEMPYSHEFAYSPDVPTMSLSQNGSLPDISCSFTRRTSMPFQFPSPSSAPTAAFMTNNGQYASPFANFNSFANYMQFLNNEQQEHSFHSSAHVNEHQQEQVDFLGASPDYAFQPNPFVTITSSRVTHLFSANTRITANPLLAPQKYLVTKNLHTEPGFEMLDSFPPTPTVMSPPTSPDKNTATAAGSPSTSTSPSTAKPRFKPTETETTLLSTIFQKNPFPSTPLRLKLAHRLGLEPKQVQFWFQNRRAILKSFGVHVVKPKRGEGWMNDDGVTHVMMGVGKKKVEVVGLGVPFFFVETRVGRVEGVEIVKSVMASF
ncbi:hypothetical protein HDU98_007490 [Podochytrium sp. JEL0797]|nr:hypothetical protein HDU98_007490 [Podochytrium sp. JEL0797]